MPGIIVIGSLNMDLVVKTPKIPQIGETILGSGFMTSPGGKGANQAVAAAKLGVNVVMAGCVGDDIFGENLMQNLSANHVNHENVKVIAGSPTGIAMIVVKDGDNFIIVDPGANSELSPSIVEDLENVIKGCNILIVQLEIPLNTIEKAIEIAKKHGVKVLLNPAPARKLSDDLLAKVDILTPNETECEIITGIRIKTIGDAGEAVAYLNNKGIPQVIVTLGSKGVIYNSGKNIIHKCVPKVKVVDTTGAGDSFTGAVAAALSQGKDIDSAVDFGNIVGTLTVMKNGAQASLPSIAEVNEYIAASTVKI